MKIAIITINLILTSTLTSTLTFTLLSLSSDTPGASHSKTGYFDDESHSILDVTMSQSRLFKIIRPLDWRLELRVERFSNGGTHKIAEIPTKELGKGSLKKSLRDTIGENREPVFSSAFTVKATGDFNLKRDANRISVVDVDGTTLATITKSEDNYIVSK
jgi:hypothetical protein